MFAPIYSPKGFTMKHVYFMRQNGGLQPRGYIADSPFDENTPCVFLTPFIIVRMDEEEISKVPQLAGHTINLKLTQLNSRHPYKTKTITDEFTGEKSTVKIFSSKEEDNWCGYFHADGHSCTDNPPIITADDIEWDEELVAERQAARDAYLLTEGNE